MPGARLSSPYCSHTWGGHGSYQEAVLDVAEAVLAVVPPSMVKVLAKQLNGGLGTVNFRLQAQEASHQQKRVTERRSPPVANAQGSHKCGGGSE